MNFNKKKKKNLSRQYRCFEFTKAQYQKATSSYLRLIILFQ